MNVTKICSRGAALWLWAWSWLNSKWINLSTTSDNGTAQSNCTTAANHLGVVNAWCLAKGARARTRNKNKRQSGKHWCKFIWYRYCLASSRRAIRVLRLWYVCCAEFANTLESTTTKKTVSNMLHEQHAGDNWVVQKTKYFSNIKMHNSRFEMRQRSYTMKGLPYGNIPLSRSFFFWKLARSTGSSKF